MIRNLTLRTILVLSFAFISVSAIMLVAGVNAYHSYQSNRIFLHNDLSKKAQIVAIRVDGYLSTITSALTATTATQTDLLYAQDEKKRHSGLTNILASHPGIRSVWNSRVSGEVVDFVSRFKIETKNQLAKTTTAHSYIHDTSKQVLFSEIRFTNTSNEPLVDISVPILRGGHHFIGRVGATLSLKYLWDLLESHHLGNSLTAYVYDRHNHLIGHSDSSLMFLSDSTPVNIAEYVVKNKQQTSYEYINSNNKKVIGGVSVIPHLEFAVVVETPISEAYKPLLSDLYRTALIAMAAVVLAIFSGWLISGVVLQPIRRLIQSAEGISKEQAPILVKVSGTIETQRLATVFNTMLEKQSDTISDLQLSEERSRNIFNNATICICNEDFSLAYDKLKRAPAETTEELKYYLENNRDELNRIVSLVEVTDVNNAGVRLFGATSRKKVLDHINNKLRSDISNAPINMLCALWEMGNDFYSDYSFLSLDGSEIETIISFRVPKTEEGFANIPVSIIDVTNIKTMERQLIHSQKMEAIGQLTGGIAHDFNNILSIILGNISLIKMNPVCSGDLQDMVGAIEKSSLRAADLTKQLLGLSRKKPTNIRTVNINDLINNLDSLIKRSVTPQVIVEYHLDKSLWLTDIDPGDLDDALVNLVINARDAMNNSGQLSIETKNCTLDANFCSNHPQASSGDYVQLIIGDNGSGMTREEQEHIFEPFFTTKSEGKGTGLGLAMVFGFIKRSKGIITVYSELELGTTFRIFLPRSDKADQTNRLTADYELELHKGHETVLVVDDEEDLLVVTQQTLKSLGYHVLTAVNGSQALSHLAAEPGIDLLFSDVVMPGGMNGFQLAEKAVALRPDLKVLLTSGFTDKTLSDGTPARFTDNLLSKPYSQNQLAAQLRSLLGSRQKITVENGNVEAIEEVIEGAREEEAVRHVAATATHLHDDICVGVEMIDKEHQYLQSLLSQSLQIQDGSSNIDQNTKDIFEEIAQISKVHFHTEEVVMAACDYPGLTNHHRVHQLLIKQIDKMQARLHQGADGKAQLMSLSELLMDHMQGMDKQFAPYIEGKTEVIEQALKQMERYQASSDRSMD